MPYYEYALDTILDVETPRDALSEEQQAHATSSLRACAPSAYGFVMSVHVHVMV